MNFKRGNTYKLHGKIDGVDIDSISKVVFKFNTIYKEYNSDGTGDVTYDNGIFTITLSQAETLSLNKQEKVRYEVAVKFTNNEVKRSQVYYTDSLETIIEEVI